MTREIFYTRADETYHHVSEIPETLRQFYGKIWSSGPVVGADFKSFNKKFKNVVKKLLPDGFIIYKWYMGHYYITVVIKSKSEKFIYMSIPDVRWNDDWVDKILIRTMEHANDWRGGVNRYTSLFTLTRDLENIYPMETGDRDVEV